jgi:hypothetical protein
LIALKWSMSSRTKQRPPRRAFRHRGAERAPVQETRQGIVRGVERQLLVQFAQPAARAHRAAVQHPHEAAQQQRRRRDVALRLQRPQRLAHAPGLLQHAALFEQHVGHVGQHAVDVGEALRHAALPGQRETEVCFGDAAGGRVAGPRGPRGQRQHGPGRALGLRVVAVA